MTTIYRFKCVLKLTSIANSHSSSSTSLSRKQRSVAPLSGSVGISPVQ